MKDKDKFVVATKDTSSGKIRPGKIFGKFRTKEFAEKATHSFAKKLGVASWHIGIFQNDFCIW